MRGGKEDGFLKKTKRMIRCPRRRKHEGGYVLSVILVGPSPLHGSSTETRERQAQGIGLLGEWGTRDHLPHYKASLMRHGVGAGDG